MSLQIQRRMAIQQAIELKLNKLITDMQELVDKETELPASQMQRHQITNLRSVAQETPSGELVKVFIQYQIGRDSRGNNWRHNSFGEKLIGRLAKLRENQAKDVANLVNEELGLAAPTEDEIDAVWIELIRHYLGQLYRYFYYRKSS